MIIEGILCALKLVWTFFHGIATTPGLNIIVLGPAIIAIAFGLIKKMRF